MGKLGTKMIPRTSQSRKVIPEMIEKVRLAIRRQQLANNMKKNHKKQRNFLIFLSFLVTRQTNIWISCYTMKTDDLGFGQKVKVLNYFI